MTAWFSNRERGRIYGIWSTAHSIGEGLTFLVVGTLAALLGWRFGFWGPGVIGVVTAADRKSVVEGKSVSVRVDFGGRSSIKKTITHKPRIHRTLLESAM